MSLLTRSSLSSWGRKVLQRFFISRPYISQLPLGQPEDQLVIVSVTVAYLGSNRTENKKFWAQVFRVHDSLQTQPGCLGHAIRRQFLGNQAWTVTVWSDTGCLDHFVQGSIHRVAVQESREALQSAKFYRTSIPTSSLPFTWRDAEHLVAQSTLQRA